MTLRRWTVECYVPAGDDRSTYFRFFTRRAAERLSRRLNSYATAIGSAAYYQPVRR